MIKYVGEISCNACGSTLFTTGTNKTTLLSVRELEKLAEDKGWKIEKRADRYGAGKCYCPLCAFRREQNASL